jgi:hypothetical protein
MTSTPKSTDAGILSQLLGLHFDHEPTILDTTYGGGRMWRGCAYQPTTCFDVRALVGVDVVGAWDDLPRLFDGDEFQVVVYDPPHQTDGGRHALGGPWADAYGTAGTGVRGHLNISHLYPSFLEAARAVLEPTTGTVLAKIADQVHGGVQQLQAVDFVLAARAAGWTVCEMVPKLRRPGPLDPKWRRQLHMRKAWSYWICAHPGPRCPAVGVNLVLRCAACGRDFRAARSDARTCGDSCRQRLSYRRRLTDSRSTAQKLSVRHGAA